jgi:hypothetical protein
VGAMTRSPLIRRLALTAGSLTAGSLLITACDTRREILDDNGVWTRLEVDWRPAGISPDGVSVYFFDRETGHKTEQLLTDATRDSVTLDSIYLHIGQYSLLAFNETERSHDYIAFRGTDRYAAAEAAANPLPPLEGKYAISAARLPPAVHTHIGEEEALGTAHLDGFGINYLMVRDGVRPRINLVAQRLSVDVEVTVHLHNMHNLYIGEDVHRGALSGMAEGVLLAAEAQNDVPATNWLALFPESYNDDTDAGTLRGTCASFGSPETTGNSFSLFLRLRDGTDFPTEERDVTRDVTHLLRTVRTGATLRLTLEIGLGIDDDDPLITLPEVEGSDGGMFEVDVSKWKSETVNIEL